MTCSSEPLVNVGILESDTIEVTLHGAFSDSNGNRISGKVCLTEPIELAPMEKECSFTLHNVVIGIGFHWEQKMEQTFEGTLRVITMPSGRLMAINAVNVEKYLCSVISSEMNADAPEEFLKAHAVISRSWLLAQMQHKRKHCEQEMVENENMRIKWYDHDDHTLFDVCADDHCQRYQGLRQDMPETVSRAIEATRGVVLTSNGELCDARFSKCCGGIMEKFSTCWGNENPIYLAAKRDYDCSLPMPDLTDEHEARKWCLEKPKAWCAAPSPSLLSKVLNGYDLDTPDFYRWKVEYTARELATLVQERTGVDFGSILAITPIHRGPSARIDVLEIKGTKHSMTIGKELEIRRSLSKTHLYSSAFVADALDVDADGVPQRWIFNGAGWGHGVGLCQIGAASMADAGITHDLILQHYYPGSQLSRLY